MQARFENENGPKLGLWELGWKMA